METAERAAKWLIEQNKENPQFIANVRTSLAKIKKPLSEISDILTERKRRLQTTMLKLQDFNVICENCLTDLDCIEKKLQVQKPISVNFDRLKKQDDHLKVCFLSAELK